MNAAWLRPRWLFSRRAAKALLLAVVIIAAAYLGTTRLIDNVHVTLQRSSPDA